MDTKYNSKQYHKMTEEIKNAVHKMAMYGFVFYLVMLAVATIAVWFTNSVVVIVLIGVVSLVTNVVVDQQAQRIRRYYEAKYQRESN